MHDPTITAVLRYRDPVRSAHWLRDAFGFRIDSINENPPGNIDYICLGYGESVLLVGPALADELRKPPGGDDGQESQSCYLTVVDIKAHYARARAHGADMTLTPEEPDAGTELYACRDPEGQLWSFGTHDFASAGRADIAPRPMPGRSTAGADAAAVAPLARRNTPIALLVYTAIVASGITAGALLLPVSQGNTVVTLLVGGHTQESATLEGDESATLGLLRSEIAGLQRERADLLAEVKRSEAGRDAVEAARDQSETRLAEATREIERARSAEAAARAATETAETNLAALSKEIDDTSASLAWERRARKKLETELQSAIAARDEARAQAGQRGDTVASLRDANKQALDEAAAKAADQASVRQGLETRLDALSKDLETERAARAKSEALAETLRAEREQIDAALKDASAAAGASRAEVARLTAELGDARRSQQAARETGKLDDAAEAALQAQIADTTQQLAAARADAEALRPMIDALRTRIKELEATDRASSQTAALSKLEKRHMQELQAKDKQIASLSLELKEARKPQKPAKAKAPAKAKGKVAATRPGAAKAQPAADDFVLEEDAQAMQPERVRRCSRTYFDHC